LFLGMPPPCVMDKAIKLIDDFYFERFCGGYAMGKCQSSIVILGKYIHTSIGREIERIGFCMFR